MAGEVNIGMSEQDRKKVAEALERILADTQTLYLKTLGFHWNVEGPHFGMLHDMFQEQYTDLASAGDEIAERIRALGCFAPASFGRYAQIASIKEEQGSLTAGQMIAQLLADNEQASATAKEVFAVAQEAKDEATSDMMIERMQAHEKAAWMMRVMVV